MNETETILVRKENGVAWLTINRPAVLNACDLSTLKLFGASLKQIETDESVHCVVITGKGRAFCAGADLQSLSQRGIISLAEDLKEGFNPICSKIFNMEKPFIAMVNGVAAGAGVGIALACDLRNMSESAKFVEAFAKMGLVPDSGATFTMPRLLGLSKAMELAFTGDGIDAKEALRLGAVNRVIAQENLEIETRELAEKLAKGPKSLGLSKRAIHRALSMDFDSALEYESLMQQIAGETEDHKEGVKAFKEKRPPNFQGK
ncbi:MAG: enoyl-CoA hydratase/isomerase family protein [Thaumarchaeota archaeon]|nr:enoyl-CoA hydratase/isomerase family protein [Nitrososphaerota archaeon]